MRYGESGRPGEILARTADRLQHGSDCSRARAMLELVADGDLSLDERRLLVRLFDDNQPEELHHLAVVLLATHYRLRAAPAAPTDIQVFGQGSPAVIRYPGGYPSYLEFNEKYDLQVQIAQRIAADEGRPVQAAPPRLPPSVQPPRPPAPKK